MTTNTTTARELQQKHEHALDLAALYTRQGMPKLALRNRRLAARLAEQLEQMEA
jgi:hypothetical protein